MRESIGASERLVSAVLCNWRCTTTIAASYRIIRSTVCRIITETCDAIWTVLMRESFLTCPSNYSRNAKQIREDFTKYFLSTEGLLNWQLEGVTRII